ncbi:50S ribosomal protein L24 [Bombilactobacillus bombi]|uniref:Large ribosomal subunit protein uL24 n=1 Tax=Bombilactobacillus bombi TaxID=1303590 RepID=A0A347SPY3_9LACO|nr:50S ribosomal protein L24 [Bombilactobacillus bombi]AXX64092.1 50S ribosomal protein L24 [Bombilactobacillus bombi]RHW47724.1 50S ribosomal protein L24 [Bombilactobacillus bombi]RHW51903.1 50S ribosomal protein L24 [Bombilactobacillus bombi]
MFVKTGDNVQVIAGKDKGKTGTVIQAFPRANKVTVKGVNMIKKHQKPSQTEPNGGIKDVEAPLDASNVKVVKAATEAATKKSAEKSDK